MTRIDFVPEMAEPCRPLSQRRLALHRPLTDEQMERMYVAIARATAMPVGVREHRRKVADRIGTVCGVLVLALLAFLAGAGMGVWE